MRFHKDDAQCILEAKKVGLKNPIFRADDQYIENLTTDSIRIDGNYIEFTQIFKILPLPEEIDEDDIINNAINIMKFYKKKCETVEYSVYKQTDKIPDKDDVRGALDKNTHQDISKFTEVDHQK